MAKLTAIAISRAKKAGYYGDGGGLYLQVSASRTKSWIFRYRLAGHLSRNGKPLSREMGLGSLETYSLAEARQGAREQRQLVDTGRDPIAEKKASRAAAELVAAKAMSFDDCASGYVAAHRAGWRNAKHASQWTNTLATYCSPAFGRLSVQAVDVGMVMRVLEPLWTAKPETAHRVRGR